MPSGMCQPRIPGTVGAEPFSAKIRYTGPDEPDYPNLIKLTVTMPHMDGESADCVLCAVFTCVIHHERC